MQIDFFPTILYFTLNKMDDIWENDDTILRGNPKDYPDFYDTVMNDINIVIQMNSFESNKLDSKKYFDSAALRDYVKDFAFDLFGEISSSLTEPMEAYFMVESYLQFVINQTPPKIAKSLKKK